VLGLVEVPEHRDAVLSSGSSQGTVGGHGNGVDVAGVAVVVRSQFELRQFPDLWVTNCQ